MTCSGLCWGLCCGLSSTGDCSGDCQVPHNKSTTRLRLRDRRFLKRSVSQSKNQGAALTTRSQSPGLHRPLGGLVVCTGRSFTSAPQLCDMNKHALACKAAFLPQQRPRLCYRVAVRAQGTSMPSMPTAVQREVLTKRERSLHVVIEQSIRTAYMKL